MTTAVAEPAAPVGTDAPVGLAQMFYGQPSDVRTDLPAESQPASTPHAEPGLATPPQEPVAPAAEVKPEPPTTEGEDEKAKAEESHRQKARLLGKQVHELKTHVDQLAEENRILKARLDGTYEEPQDPTPEQIQMRAKFAGLELASREIANQRYGEEAVNERIYAKDSDLNKLREECPWMDARISVSHQPTVEAWNILEEHAFKQKYGADPSAWKTKILAEARPAMLEELRKTLQVTPIGGPAPTVTQARGDGGPTQQPKTLAQLMYGAPART